MEKPFMKGDSFEIQLSIITRAEMGNETENQVGIFFIFKQDSELYDSRFIFSKQNPEKS